MTVVTKTIDAMKNNSSLSGRKCRIFSFFRECPIVAWIQYFTNPLAKVKAKLLKDVKQTVADILSQSLHNQVHIILDKEEHPDQVEHRYPIEVKTGTKPKSRLENTSIIDVFYREEIAGKLLIFGEPGSGKTTELVKLAEKLALRAMEDEQEPIPVLFNLSSWKKDNQSIEDWLVQELRGVKYGILRRIKYGIRKNIAQKLVDKEEIIPLLDGLDELAESRQPKCVEKINEFIFNWDNPVVVCSRWKEYLSYKDKLELKNAVKLLPLKEKQVIQFLKNIKNIELWKYIKGDKELKELVTKPLFLTILVLSVSEINLEQWKGFSSQEERLDYLFEAYIRRMLERPYKGKNKPQEEETRRWLGWLAQRLIEENQTEFFIKNIQPYWLENEKECCSERISRFISWWILVLISWGLFGWIFGFISWWILGCILVLILGCILVLILVLMNNLTLVPILKQPTQEFHNKTSLNQRILNFLKNVVTSGLIISPLLGLGYLALSWTVVNDLGYFFIIICIIQIILGFKFMKIIPDIQHLILRWVLWKKGYAPWNYARFLDYATNRLFLQRVGGGYRFIHDLLREHFKTKDKCR